MPLQISLVLLCEMQQMQGAHGSAQMQVRASPKEKKMKKKRKKTGLKLTIASVPGQRLEPQQ